MNGIKMIISLIIVSGIITMNLNPMDSVVSKNVSTNKITKVAVSIESSEIKESFESRIKLEDGSSVKLILNIGW